MKVSVVFAGILGLSLILSVSIYVFARFRIEQERTLQKLIDRLHEAHALGTRKAD